MPIGCVHSFAKAGRGKPDTNVISGIIGTQGEPLLFGGERAWLLSLDLLLAAVCASSIARRMQRQGASSIAIAPAATITALAGVIAYVYFRGLLPRRASPVMASSPNSGAREPLIQSA